MFYFRNSFWTRLQTISNPCKLYCGNAFADDGCLKRRSRCNLFPRLVKLSADDKRLRLAITFRLAIEGSTNEKATTRTCSVNNIQKVVIHYRVQPIGLLLIQSPAEVRQMEQHCANRAATDLRQLAISLNSRPVVLLSVQSCNFEKIRTQQPDHQNTVRRQADAL
jgi:hypothetical protein